MSTPSTRSVSLAKMLSVGALASCAGLQPQGPARADTQVHDVAIVKRLLYGPGPFADQELGEGHVKSMHFEEFMSATVPAFNNGGEPPNVSGESRQGTAVDGLLSDKTKINEHIDMGNAVIINGQFNLLLGAVFGGPNEGASHFFLDADYNWTIRDDIAMDPGFAEGIVKLDNFTFSTGPRPVPYSLQTRGKYPGGMDRVGSLKSGDIVIGRLGDDDADGKVDGVFFAMGALPLSSPFLPGAPFVQRIEFVSNIPIAPADAALLSISSARNCQRTLDAPPQGARMEGGAPALRECVEQRAALAAEHLRRATNDKTSCKSHCKELAAMADRLRKPGPDPALYEELAGRLMKLQNRKSGRMLSEA